MIVTDKYGDLQLEYNEEVIDDRIIIPSDIYEWWNSLSENPLESLVIYSYEVPDFGVGYEISERIIISPEGVDNIPINVIDPILVKIEECEIKENKIHYIKINDKIQVSSSKVKFIVKVSEYDPIVRNPGLVYSNEINININD